MKYIFVGLLLATFQKQNFSFQLKPFPQIKNLWRNTRLLPLWTPLDYISNINSPKPVLLDGEQFVHYKNRNKTCILLFDNCPHQGAQLSHGTLQGNNLICAYHGFKFRNGKFIGVPMTDRIHGSPLCVPRIPTLVKNNMVYFLPFTDMHNGDNIESKLVPEPYIAPEESEPNFTKITGKVYIKKNCDIITANVLDMLHISFVHSFGNRKSPLPHKIKYREINDMSGKTTFLYSSGDKSLSKNLGNSNEVIVENEFYLPSTTVTRVIANNLTKIVVTRALPINENETVLFWEVHRNFFNGNHIIESIGNIVMSFLMTQTLNEDINILKYVNEKYWMGTINTKYDITINNFLKAKSKYNSHLL